MINEYKNKRNLTLFLMLFVAVDLVALTKGECKVDLKFPDIESPLFISPAAPSESFIRLLETSSEPFFLFPISTEEKNQQRLQVKNNQMVACPGKRNHFRENQLQIEYLTCPFPNKEPIEPESLECKKRPSGCLLHTNQKCYGEKIGTLRIIGWKIDHDYFLPHITICWNTEKESPLYTKHTIYGQHLQKRIASPGRPSFKPGKMFSGKIRNLFKRKSQSNFYKDIINNDSGNILGNRNYYFARGHLAPDADFILPAEQDSTYFYANVVPQFQKFNNGNWKRLENGVRELAIERNASLTIYTGTLQVLTLEDANGYPTEIYLDPINELYPAPKIMWKVIQDKKRNEVMVVMGLNLIEYLPDELFKFYKLCDSICQDLSWGYWKRVSDWKKGPIICCSYDQFVEIVPNFNDLGRVELLS